MNHVSWIIAVLLGLQLLGCSGDQTPSGGAGGTDHPGNGGTPCDDACDQLARACDSTAFGSAAECEAACTAGEFEPGCIPADCNPDQIAECLSAPGCTGCSASACEVCAAGACVSACAAGEACEAGSCVTTRTCERTEDCYSFGEVCRDTRCQRVDPSCVDAVPNEPSGPLVLDVVQVPLDGGSPNCIHAAPCAPEEWMCGFRFRYFDPEDDVPALQSQEVSVQADGQERNSAGVIRLGPEQLMFVTCSPDGAVSGAFRLVDAAGNRSNSLCFSGAAP
jgi:hypothetical protein